MRTALVIGVMGWFWANACIQPGMVATGTYALETKDNGKAKSERLCAACGLPEYLSLIHI